MVKGKIACYIIGGWTECGYMTQFLQKINDQFDYRQRFPRKNIGKKGKARSDFKIAGTTGAALVKKVYEDMGKHREILKDYSAVLIEDDIDEHYFKDDGDGRDYDVIESRKKEITENIHGILEKNIPVFFLYALPEIEAWFIADWENTFGKEYVRRLAEMNSYFSITFKKYIFKNVLTDLYPVSEIENYGMFDGKYRKLSEEIIRAFQQYSCETDSSKNNKLYDERINYLIKTNELKYSKKGEGVNMLIRLSPQIVASVCGKYFAKTYSELSDFAG